MPIPWTCVDGTGRVWQPCLVGLVTIYMLLILFCGAVAWFFSGFAFAQRLDDRMLALLTHIEARLARRGSAA